jgi:hypothetical protein
MRSLSLENILTDFDEVDDGLTMYVPETGPVDLTTPVTIVDEDTETPPPGTRYFLETDIAKNVLHVWRSWRDGRDPNLTEALEALQFYATNDSYLPINT